MTLQAEHGHGVDALEAVFARSSALHSIKGGSGDGPAMPRSCSARTPPGCSSSPTMRSGSLRERSRSTTRRPCFPRATASAQPAMPAPTIMPSACRSSWWWCCCSRCSWACAVAAAVAVAASVRAGGGGARCGGGIDNERHGVCRSGRWLWVCCGPKTRLQETRVVWSADQQGASVQLSVKMQRMGVRKIAAVVRGLGTEFDSAKRHAKVGII